MPGPLTTSRRRGGSTCSADAFRALVGAGAILLLALLAVSGGASAADIQMRWHMVDETGEDYAAADRQARASIYRGDHMLALRCHRSNERSWLTLVFSATWFVKPKEHPRFSLSIDDREALELFFERETDYRFVSSNPPRALLEELAGGIEARISGPDYEGAPVALPLDGSRQAIDEALVLCGESPLSDAN